MEFPGKDPFRPDRLLQWELVSLKLYLLQNLTKRWVSRSEWEQPLNAGLNVMNNMIDTPLVSLVSSSCSFPTLKNKDIFVLGVVQSFEMLGDSCDIVN